MFIRKPSRCTKFIKSSEHLNESADRISLGDDFIGYTSSRGAFPFFVSDDGIISGLNGATHLETTDNIKLGHRQAVINFRWGNYKGVNALDDLDDLDNVDNNSNDNLSDFIKDKLTELGLSVYGDPDIGKICNQGLFKSVYGDPDIDKICNQGLFNKLSPCRLFSMDGICAFWDFIYSTDSAAHKDYEDGWNMERVRLNLVFKWLDEKWGGKEKWKYHSAEGYERSSDGDEVITYDELMKRLKSGGKAELDKVERAKLLKQLHLMNPAEKSIALKKLGVKPGNLSPRHRNIEDYQARFTSESKFNSVLDVISEGVVTNKYYAFDWDDNLMYMPTKIYTMSDTKDIVQLSTEEFAEHRSKIGNEPFTLRGRTIVGYPSEINPFKDFRVEGDEQFKKDIFSAKLGPAWSDFVSAVNGGRIFAIITARGHHPNTLRDAAFSLLKSNHGGLSYDKCVRSLRAFHRNSKFSGRQITDSNLLKWYFNKLCKWYPVSYGGGSAASPEELKQKALRSFMDHVNRKFHSLDMKFRNKVSNKFSIGFSDDDDSNVKSIFKKFKNLERLTVFSTAGGKKVPYSEAVVKNDLNVIRNIRRGIKHDKEKRQFKPKTFGFELEFDFTGDDLANYEVNHDDIIKDLLYMLNSDFKSAQPSYTNTLNNTLKEKFWNYLENNDLYCPYDSIEDWIDENPKPDEDEEYELEKWKSEMEQMLQHIDLHGGNCENYKMDFCTDITNSGEWMEYLDDCNYCDTKITSETKIDEFKAMFEDLGEPTSDYGSGSDNYESWQIGMDAENVEIASRILTTKDIPLIKRVLNNLCEYESNTHGGTSAHVHIGVDKENWTSFDSLAVLSMLDEEKAFGATENRNKIYTKSRTLLIDDLFIDLISTYKPSFLHSIGLDNRYDFEYFYNLSKKEERDKLIKPFKVLDGGLKDTIKKNSLKDYGLNLLHIDTLEFRYLSSQILNDINGFLEWINYYHLLVDLAKRRQRISLESRYGWITISKIDSETTDYSIKLIPH